MKANAEKCLLLVICNTTISAKVEDFNIKNGMEEKFLGIKFEFKLSFENHAPSLCTKASQKLHTLARISNHLDIEKVQCKMRAFITSQFSYCLLVWTNNQINKIHERALGLVNQNNILSSINLLERDNSIAIHERNLQVLVTKNLKLRKVLAPDK